MRSSLPWKREPNDSKLTELRRDQVGFVFQAFNLIPSLSALDNITLPLALAQLDYGKSEIDRALAGLTEQGLGPDTPLAQRIQASLRILSRA
jgi:ABC-type lipoprotein export system ATPase subunit